MNLHGVQGSVQADGPFTAAGILRNKKVLLRERKRHTDRIVLSTPYAVLSRGGGGGVGTLGRGVGTLDEGGRYLGCGGRYLGWGLGGGRYLGQGVGTLDGG